MDQDKLTFCAVSSSLNMIDTVLYCELYTVHKFESKIFSIFLKDEFMLHGIFCYVMFMYKNIYFMYKNI